MVTVPDVLAFLCFLVAFLCFLAAAFGIGHARVNLLALGLDAFVLVPLWSAAESL